VDYKRDKTLLAQSLPGLWEARVSLKIRSRNRRATIMKLKGKKNIEQYKSIRYE
jgi:hypothetical protein